MTPLLHAALILRDRNGYWFLSMEEVIYICNVVCESASMTKMSRSTMFKVEDAVKEVWMSGGKMSYQENWGCVQHVKRAELMGAGRANLEWFADPMRFLNN